MLRVEDRVAQAIRPPLARRLLAEFLGSGLLAAVVVGSGITAQRLSPYDVGVQLAENALATGAGLVALILMFGPVSGAHFNPVVTVADRVLGGLSTRDAVSYVSVQLPGCCLGAVLANGMFAEPLVAASGRVRGGGGLWLAEMLATAGLVLVVFAVTRSGRSAVAPFAVASYIASAYLWTSSTSFANPAITVARTLSDTFSGIAPRSAPAFVASQVLGAAFGVLAVKTLYPEDAVPA